MLMLESDYKPGSTSSDNRIMFFEVYSFEKTLFNEKQVSYICCYVLIDIFRDVRGSNPHAGRYWNFFRSYIGSNKK